ncbi:sialoadhesin-like isoform X1 [Silurus meridionalis]|nr:sialoadhesin-like isoform X1 [Silurus meridionalis]
MILRVPENPKPVVIIKPDTQVFRGETVIFRCEIQTGRDTEWNYDWYKDDNTLDPNHDDNRPKTHNTGVQYQLCSRLF